MENDAYGADQVIFMRASFVRLFIVRDLILPYVRFVLQCSPDLQSLSTLTYRKTDSGDIWQVQDQRPFLGLLQRSAAVSDSRGNCFAANSLPRRTGVVGTHRSVRALHRRYSIGIRDQMGEGVVARTSLNLVFNRVVMQGYRKPKKEEILKTKHFADLRLHVYILFIVCVLF